MYVDVVGHVGAWMGTEWVDRRSCLTSMLRIHGGIFMVRLRLLLIEKMNLGNRFSNIVC